MRSSHQTFREDDSILTPCFDPTKDSMTYSCFHSKRLRKVDPFRSVSKILTLNKLHNGTARLFNEIGNENVYTTPS